MPAPSLERMCWRPRDSSYENSVAYLVRSLRTCTRMLLSRLARSTKLSKTESAARLSGANRSERTLVRIRSSSKPCNHTVQRKTLSTRTSHMISTRFPHVDCDAVERISGAKAPARSAICGAAKAAPLQTETRNSMAFRSRMRLNSARGFSGRARAEDRKLRKELTFGGPCFEGTLQKPTGVSESRFRGRNRLRAKTLLQN